MSDRLSFGDIPEPWNRIMLERQTRRLIDAEPRDFDDIDAVEEDDEPLEEWI